MVLTHIPLGDDTEDPVEGGKKGKGSKVVPKETPGSTCSDCPATCTVRWRGLGWSSNEHPWAIGQMKPYRVVSNSPTKWPHPYQIPKKREGGWERNKCWQTSQPNNVQTGPSP